MALLNWITQFALAHNYLIYAILVVVSFVEGPILGLICGLLFRLGYLDLVPAYIALMIGDLCGDVFWYCMGRYFGDRFINRFGKYFGIDRKNIGYIEKLFHRYKNRILIISKITMGFGFALVTLVTAGLVKIPFKRYLILNVIGQFVWTGVLISVGYVFGHLYVTFDNIFSRIGLIAALILVCAAFVGFSKYIRNRITRA